MTDNDPEPAGPTGKGDAFFDRADKVAATGNWDYAIELYIDGIRRDPGNMERGFVPLREVSMNRKAQGGKGPGMIDKLKRRGGKTPMDALANGLFLLGKEPGSIEYMEMVTKAAKQLELPGALKWATDLLFGTQRLAEKPSKRILMAVTNTYRDLEEYALAIEAATRACRVDPNDGELSNLLRDVSARFTVKQGGYEEEGRDFTRAVKDMDLQKELAQKDAMVKDKAYLESQVEKSRREYLATPTVSGKINAYADALLKFEDDQHEGQAIAVLTEGHSQTGAYQFKMRIGDVRMRQMTRKRREAQQAGDTGAAKRLAGEQLAFELDEYAERAVNYPTDLSIKYELGKRQYLAGKYDEAIVTLQSAQHDPRRRLRAMGLLGQAYYKQRLVREAVETYERALAGEVPEAQAKELGYLLAQALESLGDLQRAIDEYSKVTQLDYEYKDARQRLQVLRKQLEEQDDQQD